MNMNHDYEGNQLMVQASLRPVRFIVSYKLATHPVPQIQTLVWRKIRGDHGVVKASLR